MTEPLRIVLVDDHALFRKGIAALIYKRPDLTIVAEADNGVEAERVVRQTKPDLVLMDIHMPQQGGNDTVKAIKKSWPDIKVVMLTISEDDDDLLAAIKNGADGYLLKNLNPQDLYDMIDRLTDGHAPISGLMAARLLEEVRKPDSSAKNDTDETLSQREIEILGEVTTGATNKEIAERLSISENTVKVHLRNILKKLEVDNRTQAAVQAVRQNLLPDENQEMPAS